LIPRLINARLYLATAYASQYIPGGALRAEHPPRHASRKRVKEVLDVDPNNLSAIDGIGSIIFQMAGTPYDPRNSRSRSPTIRKHIDLKPMHPEPYYWIGVIDWTLAFRANGELPPNTTGATSRSR